MLHSLYINVPKLMALYMAADLVKEILWQQSLNIELKPTHKLIISSEPK